MIEQEINILDQLELTQQGREKITLGLWRKAIDTPECIGYHCTTLETIEHAIINGRIPGYTELSNENPDLPQAGDIYFLPHPINFPFERLPQLIDVSTISPYGKDAALRETEISSCDTAVAHRFCSILGLDISVYTQTALNYILDYDRPKKTIDFKEASEIFQRLGFNPNLINQAIIVAKKRKGIIIGLARKALIKYPIAEGDEGTDFRLQTKERGLPLSLLSCIKPLGEEEIAFFQTLRRSHRL
ncbi:MAG: hypothetical protein HY424_00120 [Candidatus Levybacteria bacterium]|nr:hypothetical protein [Candidatus Levybacteria bacterium]